MTRHGKRRKKTAGRLLGIMCVVWLTADIALAQGPAPDFTDVTAAAGISNPLRGPGLAWGDFDDDGDLDLFITAWTLVGGSPINRLWRNNGDGTFTNAASALGVAGFNNFTSSAAWADYNNDGRLDLYVTNFTREEQDFLYEQQANGAFLIRLPNTVKGNPLWNAWGDYNLDGNLDLAIARFNGPNLLFRNNGNGTFTNVSTTAGIDDIRDSERVCWVDYDNDGLPDLYTVNIYQENHLFRNKGDGTFEDVTFTAGVGSAGIGKHCAWGDYDKDGDLDLYVANIGANILFQNNGDGTFTRTPAANVDQTDSGNAWISWFAGWTDYNLDGNLDLHVASGAESASGDRNTLFANNGDGTFTDVTAGALSTTSSTAASAWGDYNNDGKPDLYLLNYGNDVLLRNDTTPAAGQAFLKIRPFRWGGAASDTVAADGIGAKITVFDAGTTTIRGYQEIISGSDALEAIFGLPTAGAYDIQVAFPSQGGNPGSARVIDKNDNASKYGNVSISAAGLTLIVQEKENTTLP